MTAGAQGAIDVAVGVVVRRDGAVLLGQRIAGKPYAGWWEFPGGKFEPGESAAQALARELHEELGIDVAESFPWVVREFVYPHARVRLHFRRVFGFSGEPHAREGQAFVWRAPDRVELAPLLPATVPVIGWLRLPALCLDCGQAAPDDDTRCEQLEAVLRARRAPARSAGDPRPGFAPSGRDTLVVFDPEPMPESRFEALYYRTRAIARAGGARLLVGSARAESFARAADGVVIDAGRLRSLPARPPGRLVAARCESAADVARAGEIGVDFALAPAVVAAECARSTRVPLVVLDAGGAAARPDAPGRSRAEDVACAPTAAAIDSRIDAAIRLGAHGVALAPGFWHSASAGARRPAASGGG